MCAGMRRISMLAPMLNHGNIEMGDLWKDDTTQLREVEYQ
jgi:hypothetical protein